MGRMTKAQIKKTLEQNSIDTLLLPKSEKLTTKQRNFAKGIANGLTKSDAYRLAYDTEGKSSIVNSEACKLSKNPKIAQVIEAYSLANTTKEYHSPLRLRELVINNLVMHAISEDIKPAQRLKATELLGKLTEVGSFTERKETTVIHQSSQLKEKLLDQLKTIVNEDGSEVTEDEGDKLLKELMGYRVAESQEREPTTMGDTEQDSDHHGSYIHINPLTQSSPETTESDSSLTNAIHDQNGIVNENKDLLTINIYSDKKEGIGGEEKASDAGWVEYKEDPPSNSGGK